MQAGRAFLTVAILAGLAACTPTAKDAAPSEKGVCYHMAKPADGSVAAAFEPVEYGVPNLETCGTRLEARRLMLGQAQTGAYEGRYVFADDQGIASGKAADGSDRLPLFNEAKRQEIDKFLQVLIDQKKADDAEAAAAKK